MSERQPDPSPAASADVPDARRRPPGPERTRGATEDAANVEGVQGGQSGVERESVPDEGARDEGARDAT